MLFNKLFLGAVLAMTSVAAIPNPVAESGTLEERSKHHLLHHCGKDASYSEEKKECVCHASGETYHKKHKKCKKDKEDKKHKEERDVLDERSPKKHHVLHHCGKHASYSEEKKECVCHDSSETFDKHHKKCKKAKVEKKLKDVKKKDDDKKTKDDKKIKDDKKTKDDDKKAKDDKKMKDDKKSKDDKGPKSERDIEERDPKKHKHHDRCGKHASYNEEKKECVCHNSAEIFERKHKKCKKHISL
ncbi:antifungal defensin [Fusarium longipes]|uniref:Antifungal defensin n=1 Tax=Fusarium longipes TaxID=694270 RepID=A0A395SWN5_9HYPO|nr:antifungal defensin [Fusarium longipes]